METDALQEGMGAVLMQAHRPLAFISKAFPPRNMGLSAYEKELWALIHAVQKWRTYLFGNHFIIKTDHQSLKYLLEQKVITMLQQKWLSKLVGLNYTISYKKGIENKVADALSRRGLSEAELIAISLAKPGWLVEIQASWTNDALAKQIITNATA